MHIAATSKPPNRNRKSKASKIHFAVLDAKARMQYSKLAVAAIL